MMKDYITQNKMKIIEEYKYQEAIKGILSPDSGCVRVCGVDPVKEKRTGGRTSIG